MTVNVRPWCGWRTGWLVACVLIAGGAQAGAETLNCTSIGSVPYTISTPGIYCLKTDLFTGPSGEAIRIDADDVVLDLNGHTLDGTAAGSGAITYGIFAIGRRNLTLKNGTIRGFLAGIHITDFAFPPPASAGHRIENIRADRNTSSGIIAVGRNMIIRENHVLDTGGTTAFGSVDVWAWGMQVVGSGIHIVDNDITTVTRHGVGVSTGIRVFIGSDVLIVDNRISQADEGVRFDAGRASGKYRDNLTSGVTTRFTGGLDAGNNN